MVPSEQEPFRLEDEPENEQGNGPGDDVRPPPPEPRPVPEPRPGSRPEPPVRVVDEEAGVDTRTVAEKRGDAIRATTGPRPPPEGWPGEALSFPLRPPGPLAIGVGGVLLALLDLVTRGNFFLGLLLKLVALVLFLRWQLHVASRSAAGHDVPAGWGGAMDMRREHVRGIGIVLVAAVVLCAPGIVAGVLERPFLALVLFLVGGVLLAAGALSQVVGDPTLMRPWNVLAWVGKRPLGLLAGTAGWWAAGWTEVVLGRMGDASTPLYLLTAIALRVAGLYLWLLSARALGVVGRSWSLFGDDDEDEDEASTSPAG